jgi:hypothetical protein
VFGGRMSAAFGNYGSYNATAHIDLPEYHNVSVKLDCILQHQDPTTGPDDPVFDALITGDDVEASFTLKGHAAGSPLLKGALEPVGAGKWRARLTLEEHVGGVIHVEAGALKWHLDGDAGETPLDLQNPEMPIFPPEGELSFAPQGCPQRCCARWRTCIALCKCQRPPPAPRGRRLSIPSSRTIRRVTTSCRARRTIPISGLEPPRIPSRALSGGTAGSLVADQLL